MAGGSRRPQPAPSHDRPHRPQTRRALVLLAGNIPGSARGWPLAPPRASLRPMLIDALTLQLGYNASLVAIGAGLLGIAAGATGTFLFLGKRALVSDAVSHATLPGMGLAFILMVALGGDGRNLPGLLAGSALSAGLGLLCVSWLTRRTRLSADAAIGAVLSVFFGAGVVLLTIIQTMSGGRQAGLESFLLGSTAGMLMSDATTIAVGGALSILAVWILRRPMTLVAFDQGYARSVGVNVRLTD